MAHSRITVQIVHDINKFVVKNTAVYILNPTGLQSAISKPDMLAHYMPNSTPAQRAAALAHGIIMNHPFLDGNKRTAEIAANEYLRLLGHNVLVKDDKSVQDSSNKARIENAHKEAARGNMTAEQLAALYTDVLRN